MARATTAAEKRFRAKLLRERELQLRAVQDAEASATTRLEARLTLREADLTRESDRHAREM